MNKVNTLEEAAVVLTRHRHRGGEWSLGPRLLWGPDQYDVLEEFEAVAVARRYQEECAAPVGEKNV